MGTHGINTSMISGILSLQGVQDRSFFNNEEQPNDKPAATTCPCGKARRQTIKYKKGVTGQFPCELCKLYIQKNPSPTVFVCLECEGSSGKRGWAAHLDCKKARAEADKRASEQAARLDAGRRAEECTAKKVKTCPCGKAKQQTIKYNKGVTGYFPCEVCKLYIQKRPSPTVFVFLECPFSVRANKCWVAHLDCKKARA